MSDTKISEAAPAAWLHEEDSDRIVSAAQKATAIRDGGASASSVKPYTVAAYTHPQPAELAFDVEEMLTACVPGGSIVDPQVVADNIRAWFADRKPAELAEQQGVELPRPLEELRDAAQHALDCADGGDDYACGRRMVEALTTLGIMEKTGRGLWSTNVPIARSVVDALAATGKQQVGEVQGDALAAINRVVEQLEYMERGCRIHPDYLDDARVAQAALAARQPGAQMPVGEVYQGSARLPQARLSKPLPIGSLLYAAPPAQGIDLGPGVRAIADERQRQVDAEGYNAENDADYKAGELANAALAYVEVAAMDLAAGGRSHIAMRAPPACWPWHRLWWKPRDARRDLVRAGALIAAQLDVIDSARDAAPGVDRG